MEDDDDDDEDDDDDRFNLNESVDGLVGVIGLRRRCRSATSLAWKVDSLIKKRTIGATATMTMTYDNNKR